MSGNEGRFPNPIDPKITPSSPTESHRPSTNRSHTPRVQSTRRPFRAAVGPSSWGSSERQETLGMHVAIHPQGHGGDALSLRDAKGHWPNPKRARFCFERLFLSFQPPKTGCSWRSYCPRLELGVYCYRSQSSRPSFSWQKSPPLQPVHAACIQFQSRTPEPKHEYGDIEQKKRGSLHFGGCASINTPLLLLRVLSSARHAMIGCAPLTTAPFVRGVWTLTFWLPTIMFAGTATMPLNMFVLSNVLIQHKHGLHGRLVETLRLTAMF